MTIHRVRALAIFVILGLCSLLGHWMLPTDHLADHQAKIDLEQVFPTKFGGWSVDTSQPVSIVSPDVQEMLDHLYNQVLTRTYVDDRGDRIMLSVAYGGDQSDATRAHRPDVCYPAQGFEILDGADAQVEFPQDVLRVRHMTARLGPRIEPVTFWFVVGDRVALSGQDQKLAEMRYSLRGTIADGMLVRVSSIDRDTASAYALQAGFIRQLRAAFDPAWAPRVFGAPTR